MASDVGRIIMTLRKEYTLIHIWRPSEAAFAKTSAIQGQDRIVKATHSQGKAGMAGYE